MTSRSDCPQQRHAVAWLQRELDAEESVLFERHLESCPACREDVAVGRRLLATLGQPPVDAPFEARTSAIVRAAGAEMSRSRRRAAVVAVAVIALAGVFAVDAWRAAAFAAVDRAALAWLGTRLQPDGTWDRADWTGPRAEEVGIHSLALLALAKEETDVDGVRRATEWLMSRQAADGSFGVLGQGYSQPVATLALIESWRITGDERVRSAAERALAVIREQAAEGPSAAPLAAWNLHALMRADELAWPQPRETAADLTLPELVGPADTRAAAALGPLYANSVEILAPAN